MNDSADKRQLDVILQEDGFILEWQTAPEELPEQSRSFQQEIFQHFHDGGISWLFNLGFAPKHLVLPESLGFWRDFAAEFVRLLALAEELEKLRHRVEIEPISDDFFAELPATAPMLSGGEFLNATFLELSWERLQNHFRDKIREHRGTVADFMHRMRPDIELAGRVFLHLVENNRSEKPFAFIATYSTQLSDKGTARHLPLKNALTEFAGRRKELLDLLKAVYRAARQSELLSSLLDSGDIFQPLAFDANRALTFLREVHIYEESGIRCRIPNWWTARRKGVALSLRVGDKRPSQLGFGALLECVPELVVDGEPISLAEARSLLAGTDALVLIKNKWVEVDRDKLSKVLDAYTRAGELLKDGLSLREAMQFMAETKTLGDGIETKVSVSFGKWLKKINEKLRNPKLVRSIKPGDGFLGSLRPYQQLGLNWLAFLDSLGFGSCLADDMGLGKTVQVLAFFSAIRNGLEKPSLLLVPASLIGNWQDEIRRFLPDLRVFVAHASAGADCTREIPDCEIRQYELVISTYGMLQRREWLRNTQWQYVILDEAQVIKNAGTRQSRLTRGLKSRNRLIMTGTPVENRLDDLWSLFDFLNPGLLGTATEFKRRISNIHESSGGYGRLRKVVSPFILRRLKTDRSIISDLPDKVEMKSYAELSRQQIVLYRGLVEELGQKLLSTDPGIERKGLVLTSLMKLKQICNHPDQYVGGGDFSSQKSGKFERLREIAETILAKHECLLVFTQFREITEPLDKFLAEVFGHPGVVLHGGVPVKKRRDLVARFQESIDYVPYFVLSVKAAGLGLNLTRANHVVHFDRWWNPAVENQATDRAFRIGQEKKVIVHKFICRGTVEEKIDRMIEEKTAVSNQVIPAVSGEGWITEMSNKQLEELFSYS